MDISVLKIKQGEFFLKGLTKDIGYRKSALVRFRESIKKHESAVLDALYKDFHKSEFEGVATETGLVLRELDHAIKEIWKWGHPKSIKPTLLNFPSKDAIHYEPYGNTLIIAPWNYPFQLAIAPLIGAIAAGNTAVIKPSELTPATADIIETIITEVFPEEYIAVVQGGIPESTALLAERWDYIFFTGSVFVGKIVAKAAAIHLTPTTLELGGKNPCVVDETAPIKLITKRIVWGKFLNGGQTCVAPDYILVHESIKDTFIACLSTAIEKAYGKNPELSEDYPRIINLKNFKRLEAMLSDGKVAIGGQTDQDALYIAPTVLEVQNTDGPAMADEIFGPILPVLTYQTQEDIEEIILTYDKPLSGYVFSRRRSFQKWFLQKFSFGGGAINDTVSQFTNDLLPFGGVGHSGVGAYHGKHSFTTFSHAKSISKKGLWLDLWVRYAPYKGKLELIRKVLKWL